MIKWWNKFKEKLAHWYWEGLTGEQCWECSGLKEHMRKERPKIMKIQRQAFGDQVPRYGCPQDYKDAQDFIDDL